MTKIYNSLYDLRDQFDVFIFDAYGVFWDGNKFFANSREVMEQLRKDGKIVAILSNTTQVASDAINSYVKKGLLMDQHYDYILTSGEALREQLVNQQLHFKNNPEPRNIYMFGTPKPAIFKDTVYQVTENLEEADCFYISIPQLTEAEVNAVDSQYRNALFESKLPKEGEPRRWDSIVPEVFMPTLQQLKERNLPALNANPDLTAAEGSKAAPGEESTIHFVVRQGAIAQMYRQLGGEVVEYGKPHRVTFEKCLNDITSKFKEFDKERIVMIGDTIRTDIKGGNLAGIKTCLCTNTGVTHNRVQEVLAQEPNKDILDILGAELAAEGARADFLIQSVGGED